MAKILHKKETGNLLWYFYKKIKSQDSPPLETLQKWGLPIPPTLKITLSTSIKQKELEDFLEELKGVLQDWIGKKSSKTQIFSLSLKKDDEEEVLFLSKVGLCPDLIASTNNLLTQQIYWLNLLTLLTTYGTCCLQIAKEEFERVKTDQKKYEGAYLDFDLSHSALEELIKEAQNKIEKKQNGFSYQAEALLQNALVHLIKTHFSKNAFFAEGFNSFENLTLTIQAETLSTDPAENADLVLYSKDPLSHKKEWTGEYLQGYDRLLSSIYSIHPLSQTTRLRYGYLEESFEELDQASYTSLLKILKKVPSSPNGYWKLRAQFIEGQVVFLDRSLIPSFDFEHYGLAPLYLHKMKRCARIPAISVSSGYAEGKVAFSLEYAKKCLDQNIPYILATTPSANHLPLVNSSAALLIMGGGMTSALAEKAREIKIPALMRSKALFFHSQKKELYLGEYRIQEGDFISIDALSHTILIPLQACEKQKEAKPLT